MRLATLVLAAILAAPAAWGGAPYALDRAGTLWRATATPDGVLLTASQEQVVVGTYLAPFTVGLAGATDTDPQVVADDITGKVVVVWRRSWSEAVGQVMAGVWDGGEWEQLDLSQGYGDIRRFDVRLAQMDGDGSEAGDMPRRSFVHVAWQAVQEGDARVHYALLDLSADGQDNDRLQVFEVSVESVQFSCGPSGQAWSLALPLFAVAPPNAPTLLLMRAAEQCSLALVEVAPVPAPPPPAADSGISVVAQRRRHVPWWGVRSYYPDLNGPDLAGGRLYLGRDLVPVVYKVRGDGIDYATMGPAGWSLVQRLALDTDLELSDALLLVEALAR